MLIYQIKLMYTIYLSKMNVSLFHSIPVSGTQFRGDTTLLVIFLFGIGEMTKIGCGYLAYPSVKG